MKLKIDGSSPFAEKAYALNREAFPSCERIPTRLFRKLTGSGAADCLAVCDGNEFAGFALVSEERSFVYIAFFAIEKRLRGKGIGSRTLDLIRDRFGGKPLVLDIEPLDENAENSRQRERRRSFYFRCGLKASGYCRSYRSMTFEILCDSLPFDAEGFKNYVEKFRSPDFQPVIFKNRLNPE